MVHEAGAGDGNHPRAVLAEGVVAHQIVDVLAVSGEINSAPVERNQRNADDAVERVEQCWTVDCHVCSVMIGFAGALIDHPYIDQRSIGQPGGLPLQFRGTRIKKLPARRLEGPAGLHLLHLDFVVPLGQATFQILLMQPRKFSAVDLNAQSSPQRHSDGAVFN